MSKKHRKKSIGQWLTDHFTAFLDFSLHTTSLRIFHLPNFCLCMKVTRSSGAIEKLKLSEFKISRFLIFRCFFYLK
jgi:hypothetical protein